MNPCLFNYSITNERPSAKSCSAGVKKGVATEVETEFRGQVRSQMQFGNEGKQGAVGYKPLNQAVAGVADPGYNKNDGDLYIAVG